MSRILKLKNNLITQGCSNSHMAVDIVGAGRTLDYIVAHTAGTINFCQIGQKNAKGSTGNKSYGNCVKIKHSGGYETLYAHMKSVSVKNGQKVSKGQVLGYMGDTGNAYGAHLHFEVRKYGARINPTSYLDKDLPNNSTVVKSNSGKKLYLPSTATSWRVYSLNKKPVKGNECGFLKPSKFGGLEYDILRYTQTDVAVIKTRDFGEVQIYVAKSTGAIIK